MKTSVALTLAEVEDRPDQLLKVMTDELVTEVIIIDEQADRLYTLVRPPRKPHNIVKQRRPSKEVS